MVFFYKNDLWISIARWLACLIMSKMWLLNFNCGSISIPKSLTMVGELNAWPFWAAMCIGLNSIPFVKLSAWPSSTRIFTISKDPSDAATCRTVFSSMGYICMININFVGLDQTPDKRRILLLDSLLQSFHFWTTVREVFNNINALSPRWIHYRVTAHHILIAWSMTFFYEYFNNLHEPLSCS